MNEISVQNFSINWVTVIWFILRRCDEIENTFRDLAPLGYVPRAVGIGGVPEGLLPSKF